MEPNSTFVVACARESCEEACPYITNLERALLFCANPIARLVCFCLFLLFGDAVIVVGETEGGRAFPAAHFVVAVSGLYKARSQSCAGGSGGQF